MRPAIRFPVRDRGWSQTRSARGTASPINRSRPLPKNSTAKAFVLSAAFRGMVVPEGLVSATEPESPAVTHLLRIAIPSE
jgi:hypothetical protein